MSTHQGFELQSVLRVHLVFACWGVGRGAPGGEGIGVTLSEDGAPVGADVCMGVGADVGGTVEDGGAAVVATGVLWAGGSLGELSDFRLCTSSFVNGYCIPWL